MVKIWFSGLLIVCLPLCCLSWTLLEGNAYEFNDGDQIRLSLKNDSFDISDRVILKTIVLAPRSKLSFQLLDIPTYVAFVLTQVHSYKYNITLSKDFDLSSQVNGTNIGLVKENVGMPPHNMQFFITNHHKIKVMCLIAFEAHRDFDPIPGGCNQEFPTEIAPYLSITYNDAVVTMNVQPASYNSHVELCDVYPSPVELEVYHIYMQERDFSSESYFDAIKKMITVEGMMKSGTLLHPPHEGSSLQRIHSAYPGTGSVYGVVARVKNGKVSAYVPAVTFACGNKVDAYDDCDIFSMPFSEVLCALMLFIGMFICVCGHRKFLIGSTMVAFLWGTVISCMILGMNFGTGYGVDVMGILYGFLLAALWCFLWLLFGVPIIAALSSTLALGFLLASAVMFAGLGNDPWLIYDASFWTVFASITASVPILFRSALHVGNMVACATLGAYVFVAPIDHYVGSNLKYIFLNTMRRAINPDFRLATIDPPFEVTDLLLILTWLTLSVAGTATQLFLQRRRPPFPAHTAWCLNRGGGGGGGDSSPPPPSGHIGTTQPRRGLLLRAAMAGIAGARGTERTPLLVDVRIPDGATPDSVFESPAAARRADGESTPPTRRASAPADCDLPPRAAQPPPPSHAHQQPSEETVSDTEKLANRLLAVLEPDGK